MTADGQIITRLTRSVVLLTAACCVLAVASLLSLYFMTSKKTVAIAVDARGVVVPLVPLDKQLVSESRVVGFVDECLRKSFQHDYLHFQTTLPVAQDCYTPGAADAYAQSMQTWIRLMLDKRMVMSATIPKQPRVVRVYRQAGSDGQVVNWDIQAEVEVFFEGKSERIAPSKYIVQVTVKRVSLDLTPRGILIDKLSLGSGV